MADARYTLRHRHAAELRHVFVYRPLFAPCRDQFGASVYSTLLTLALLVNAALQARFAGRLRPISSTQHRELVLTLPQWLPLSWPHGKGTSVRPRR